MTLPSGWDDIEPFTPSRIAKPIVEAHEAIAPWCLAAPRERRGELEGVGRPKRVKSHEACGALAERARRRDDIGIFHQIPEPGEGFVQQSDRDAIVATVPMDRRLALHWTRPPEDDVAIRAEQRRGHRGALFRDQRGYHRRAVPEHQRPSARSSSRALSTPAPTCFGPFGGFRSDARTRPLPSCRRPAFARRCRRAWTSSD